MRHVLARLLDAVLLTRPALTAHEKTPTLSITDALAKYTPHLMSIPGVVGTAEGREGGRPCVVVYVKQGDVKIEGAIPRELDGYPVRIEESGEIGPLR